MDEERETDFGSDERYACSGEWGRRGGDGKRTDEEETERESIGEE